MGKFFGEKAFYREGVKVPSASQRGMTQSQWVDKVPRVAQQLFSIT
jgi:hypothetical protein